MNERIRELADQILPNEKEFNQGDPKDWGYFFSGGELEKFAQSIVRECADICYNRDFVFGSAYGDEICKHFGIE